MHSDIQKNGDENRVSEIPSRHWSDFWVGLMAVVGLSAGASFLFNLIFG